MLLCEKYMPLVARGILHCSTRLLSGILSMPMSTHIEQRISCHPFAKKQLRGANRQDFVFIRPPGISHGAFELRMDNIWFCKVLLLFQIDSNTDLGWKRHSCAFVSVLEEYTGARRPGNSFRLLITLTVLMHIAVI